ncbi:UNVERIFIED_CONTAM: hypothetical protein Sradi_7207000 [Sesamum radiatum]|uniref:Reverse transcriptase domain-containing protein n=1 Tax=Sesamum radiatum TaxID=300843 RepID=A0AAW2IQ05_SESRA
MIKVASWNVRGLNGLDHQRAVEQLVSDHKLSFLGLIETRVSFANVQRIRRNLLVNWSWFDDYSGPAGRIWLVWNPLEVGVDILRVDSQFIHCCAFNKRLHTRCLITVLYGDYDIIPRRNLWRALGDLSTDISDEPWLVLGDFNAVMDDSVCGRAADTSISMTEFRTCVRDAGLVQLPSTGCPFTWHNCSEGPRSLWKRLDRMLVNPAWLDAWPNSSYLCALPSTSDHSPLILAGMDRGDENAIFRFDNFLTRIPGFLNSVEEIWKHRIAGTAMYEIVSKAFLEKAQALFTNSREDIFLNLVKCCRRVYAVAVKLEISMLQQRAKLRWLKHGDHNSKVFFRKINASRVKQRVYQIKRVGGELLTAQNDVNQEFISYFQNLFGGPSLHRSLDLEFLRPELKHTITPAEASLLTAHVTRSEVKEAFFDIDVESAPGPDGYTSEFYRAAWSVVGQDLFKAVGEFFHTGKLLKQINTTLIALIPKVNMPLYVSDYRPISCCNVLYKAITKIIVKRIHRILPLMIDNSQTAFVPGRSITDNILLAQELLAGYNQMRLPNRCTLKVDIQKAYDSVEWDFLLEVLSFFSVSINGSIHGFFKGGRGLRQGDPMSPYLFVLVMEIGNALLKYRVKQATDFQYHWKCKDSGLINLCFADDVLLFCKAHLPSIKVLTDTLNEFAAMSGLKAPNRQSGSKTSRLEPSELSYAGRLQLIKSVLSTLHMYWASAFILPKGILQILEKKMRRFLWHGSGNAKVAWEQICKPKQEGGLGIRSLMITNQALMLKQLWRLIQNDGTSIWVEWIQRHRLRQSTIWTLMVQRGRGAGKKLLKLRPLLQRGVIYKVGDGSSFSLWQDVWHERGPLCLTFPRGPVITGLPLSSPLSSVLQRNQWSWPASTDADIAEIISQLPPTTISSRHDLLEKQLG